MADNIPPAEYDPERGCYRCELDDPDGRPILGLLSVFERIEEDEAVDVPCLYEVIDCDALDKLLVGHRQREHASHVTLTFETDRFHVRIDSAPDPTTITVQPAWEAVVPSPMPPRFG